MLVSKLDEIKQYACSMGVCGRIGVIAAEDEHTLQAISEAMESQIIIPVLYGNPEGIRVIWEDITNKELPEVIPCNCTDECVAKAVEDVRAGKLQSLMKGKLETGVLMKAIVNKDHGIKKNDLLSLVGIIESPYYHKLFAITDMGLITYPDLQQKAGIIKNAVTVMKALGIEKPKVAALAAVEHVNPKMPETVEAEALKQMNEKGLLPDCVVEGPISFDLSMNFEAAKIKGYQSQVAGDADILMVPDFVAGNLLSKGMIFMGGARSCGVVVGAQVPVVLVSRAATAADKFYSILLSVIVGNQS